jgi:hypothetical protein
MKHTFLALLLVGFIAAGCSPQFWGGAATGALGAGAGYELRARQQLNQLEEDYKAGRITREQYEDRKREIERGSIIY